jgi:opacity protein-like surface antigen
MRTFILMMAAALTSVAASAQSSPGPSGDKVYVEVGAQSAFGQVTSQSFGGEVGIAVADRVQIFAEVGRARDVATSDISASAQQIAGALSQSQAAVAYRVKEPATFGLAGVKYVVPVAIQVQPYVMAGGGVARVSQNVTFTVAGHDVTAALSQPRYGNIILGSDLSGSFTRAMIGVGGGAIWPAWRQLVVDVQYRYGRILVAGDGINVNRAGVAVGVRF